MSKLIVALFFSVPLSAHAELVFVEYEGTISFIENPNCVCPLEFANGDPVC
jgi:hypothetical protein